MEGSSGPRGGSRLGVRTPGKYVKWMSACWVANKLEDLDNDTEKYQSINGKLYTGVLAMLEKAGESGKQLIHDIQKEMQRYAAADKYMSGRHVTFLVVDSFRAFDRTEIYIGIDRVTKLRIIRDDLKAFQNKWAVSAES